MKNIHPKMDNCEYTCASCGTKFNITSTKTGKYSLDVCSNCHPYYVGATSGTALRGRAEKLSNKFETGKSATKTVNKPKKLTKTKKDSKVIEGLDSL